MAHTKIRLAGNSHGNWTVLVDSVPFEGPIGQAVKDWSEVLYQYSLKANQNPVVKIEREGLDTVIRVANYDAFAVTAY